MTSNYREQIQEIRSKLLYGHITVDQAKELVDPLLAEMNKKGKEIAKKHGKKYTNLTFGYVIR